MTAVSYARNIRQKQVEQLDLIFVYSDRLYNHFVKYFHRNIHLFLKSSFNDNLRLVRSFVWK